MAHTGSIVTNQIVSPFGGFSLGDTIDTIPDIISFEADIDNISSVKQKENFEEYKTLIGKDGFGRDLLNDGGAVTDATIGGNDVINAMFQFGVDDDIVMPINRVTGDSFGMDSDRAPVGLGGIYKEMFEDNQHILYLTMGVPKFKSLTSFFGETIDSQLASLLSRGEDASIPYLIGTIFGKGLTLALKLPFLPLIGLYKLMNIPRNMAEQVTKYCELNPRMDLYYQAVASILIQLCVNFGFYDNMDDISTNAAPDDNIPDIIKSGGDIIRILSKRKYRRDPTTARMDHSGMIEILKNNNLKDAYIEMSNQVGYYLKTAVLKEMSYIGIRIEKGSESSESLSNNTGLSPVASSINSKISEKRGKAFMISAEKIANSLGMAKLVDGGSGFIDATLDSLRLGGIAASVVKGNAMFNIPEMWMDSNFSKSYSFTMQLRSKYSDPISIYQNLLIPYAMIMAASFPMGTGENTYSSPMGVQAYVRGQIAIPYGIIDSLTVSRGLSEYGWTKQGLPLALDISFTIKDLSPALYLSIPNKLKDIDIFSPNSGMHEYLLTLSGIGLEERINPTANIQKRLKHILTMNKDVNFNPKYWGTSLGYTKLARTVSNFLPESRWRVPNN